MAEPQLGIFARVFPTGPAAAVARSVTEAGYRLVQLNLRAIGLPTIPDPAAWNDIDVEAVRRDFAALGIAIWGVSGTCNLAHPDPDIRRAGTLGVVELVRRAPRLGAVAVTLCTGSRDPQRMWTHHPDNATEAAWRDLRGELDLLVAAALEAGVLLGVEPEPGNVVRDAAAAVRLISELGPDAHAIGVIADSANLLAGRPVDTHRGVLERSFAALADRIACLHAKDLVPWATTLAGDGIVDYSVVASLYRNLGLRAPLIVQDVTPDLAAPARTHLEGIFEQP